MKFHHDHKSGKSFEYVIKLEIAILEIELVSIFWAYVVTSWGLNLERT